MVYGDLKRVFVVFKVDRSPYVSEFQPNGDVYVSVCQTLDRAKDRAQRTYSEGRIKGISADFDKLEWELAQDPGEIPSMSWRYIHTVVEEGQLPRRAVVMIIKEETVE